MRPALAAGALLLSIALTAAAEPALACNAGRIAVPARHAGRHGPPPWVIGDSTAIFAAPVLGRLGVAADAHGCRQFDQGVAMVARRGRRAPEAVVLALGANGQVSRRQIARARRILGPGRFLVLVTPRNSPATRAAMLGAQRAHPDRVLTLDWTGFSNGHPGWFGGDGLHVTYAGAGVYARLIRSALDPFLGPPRTGRPLDLPLDRSDPRVTSCGRIRAYGRTTHVFLTRGADVVSCELARRRMRQPRLHPEPRWRYLDWRTVGRGPWTDVLARRDRSIVVAGITA
jgi:hypothetical protein